MFTDFREREREKEREIETERQRNIDVTEQYQSVASCMPPTGDRTCNLGMCPDQGLNPQPFGAWDNIPTETPGQGHF